VNKKFTASIVFVSGATLESDDLPFSVRMHFEPNETEDDEAPPAYVIARDIFLSDIQGAVLRYMEATGIEMDFQYLPPGEDPELLYDDEGEDDEDGPAFGEDLKPRIIN
jgi:hypothetical protein